NWTADFPVPSAARSPLGTKKILQIMTAISDAVVLMAGEGSRLRQGYGGQARLRGSDKTILKPFVPVLGRPLISYTLDALIGAGIKTLTFVVDRKLGSIFDLEDAMKIRTRGDRVIGIGKKLEDYDAIDIGLFVCPVEIFGYLERAKSESSRNDCSLADGIRLMAGDDKV